MCRYPLVAHPPSRITWQHEPVKEMPSEDAYGRVTNAERFRVVHAAASALLDDLVTQYDVERQVTHDETLAPEQTVERLVPAGGGAALTVAFTSFPGLMVRFGDCYVEPFPSCGCDACGEEPESVADEFASRVAAVVAGQFSEHLRRLPRPSLTYEFERGNPGWSRLTYGDVSRLGRPGFRRWLPWKPR